MRHAFLAFAASILLSTLAGCACNNCTNCNNCNQANGCAHAQQPAPGGTTSYPYYTTRGPRDFLETHPQSIGP